MRKIIGVFLTILMCLTFVLNVHAKTLTIEEVYSKLNEEDFIKSFKEFGGDIRINSEAKTLDIYLKEDEEEEETKLYAFNYNDDFIELDNRSLELTEDNIEEYTESLMGQYLFLGYILNSVIELSGYENKTISSDADIDFTKSYDQYGIQIESEHFEYEIDSGSVRGEFIKYFKLSLDTDKIGNLINDYGIDVKTTNPEEEMLSKIKPSLEVEEITSNSISLIPSISGFEEDAEIKPLCYIYRSTSENGEYEKVFDLAVDCTGNTNIVDKDLKSDTTYYYKIVYDKGTLFSDILKVTTSSDKKVIDTSSDEKVKNPSTGVLMPLIIAVFGGIVSLIVMVYIKRKNFSEL